MKREYVINEDDDTIYMVVLVEDGFISASEEKESGGFVGQN